MERESAVQIWNEIRLWSDEVLEVPCPGFANLPPCPFARMAWLNNNVVVHVTYELSDVVDVKSVFPHDDDKLHSGPARRNQPHGTHDTLAKICDTRREHEQ